MAKNPQPPISVKEAVYRLQLALLHGGAASTDHLYAAGSVLSAGDYSDVVTERSIASLCGHPLCPNPLPSSAAAAAGRRRKGRYRISLSQHRVYDLLETSMFCSSHCLVASKTFQAGLAPDRCSALDPARIAAVLGLFPETDGEGSVADSGLGAAGDLGLSRLRIEERTGETVAASEEWAGPSNAIEGYVPRRDRRVQGSPGPKSLKRGSKASNTLGINDMDFSSVIITEDEYTVSKMPSSSVETGFYAKPTGTGESLAKNASENQFTILETSYTPAKSKSESMSGKWEGESSKISTRNDIGIQEISRSSHVNSHLASAGKQSVEEVTEKLSGISLRSSLKTSQKKKFSQSVTWADEKSDGTGRGKLCEVRAIEDTGKPSGEMKAGHSGPWVDEKGDSSRSMDVCEVGEMGNIEEASDTLRVMDVVDNNDTLRFTSAEACAIALNAASEAVAGEEVEVSNAISEAGIIILPPPDNVGEEEPMEEDDDGAGPEQPPIKWPKKPGSQQSELFNPEDSWFDTPPDDFNLTLSTFAKMWNALFEWTTSSTLAYIYGRDESLHEEYLSVNGREYLQKVVLGDGRSSEIKQTLAGSLARAIPGLVAELKLPTPVSSLEQAMGRLLETMSFVEALPPFRLKQWQVIVLLFIEALSVFRLPALTPHMANRRMLLHKVLDGAQISGEEYEVMKDLMIPLGRTPHFSAQSGA